MTDTLPTELSKINLTPMDIPPVPGVMYVTPPLDKIPSIHAAIDAAFRDIPPDANGGLFAVANEAGANAAIVVRTKSDSALLNDWKVEAYIGRTWKGSSNYGVNVMRTW